MRRHHLYTLLLVLFLFQSVPLHVFALSEGEIEEAVDDFTATLQSDWGHVAAWEADPQRCGGLLSPGDVRALAHYARKDPFQCLLKSWCYSFDPTTGQCLGQTCTVNRFPSQMKVESITPASCTDGSTSINPRGSTRRTFQCGYLERPGVWHQRAQAECVSTDYNVTYEQTWWPFSYNCLVRYSASPALPSDPDGELMLDPPHTSLPASRADSGRWETAFGSNVATESALSSRFPRDSSIGALDLDFASFNAGTSVVHDRIAAIGVGEDYPSLERTIGRLLSPPEVRLILPKGSHGLEHEGSPLFERLFSFAGDTEEKTPVVQVLGNEPDALKTTADYLRSIPLLEVTYKPVTVLVPMASTVHLQELEHEWRVWRTALRQRAAEESVSVDAKVLQTVQKNIEALQSYVALQESVRDYRLHFPRYIDALLRYVEEVNRFFREEWAEVNAKRLEGWHAAYKDYLPVLQQSINAYHAASQELSSCLGGACRLDALPVKTGVQPRHLVPDDADQYLLEELRVWLPEAFPLWGNFHGEVSLWHPAWTFGHPLPDLTIDLSEIFPGKQVVVPVLKIEPHQMRLPYPPPLGTDSVVSVVEAFKRSIQPLPELAPPLFQLSFPELALPNPATSLFVVPEAPQVLKDGSGAYIWPTVLAKKTKRMMELVGICDPSPQARQFLVHEYQIGKQQDPAAVQSAAFVAKRFPPHPFTEPSPSWPHLESNKYAPSRLALRDVQSCPTCSTVRPQRFIRQHFSLGIAWERFQDELLTAIDVWNAQVKFVSVVPRGELLREDSDFRPHSGLPHSAFSPASR